MILLAAAFFSRLVTPACNTWKVPISAKPGSKLMFTGFNRKTHRALHLPPVTFWPYPWNSCQFPWWNACIFIRAGKVRKIRYLLHIWKDYLLNVFHASLLACPHGITFNGKRVLFWWFWLQTASNVNDDVVEYILYLVVDVFFSITWLKVRLHTWTSQCISRRL